jgi:hypothetical protein
MGQDLIDRTFNITYPDDAVRNMRSKPAEIGGNRIDRAIGDDKRQTEEHQAYSNGAGNSPDTAQKAPSPIYAQRLKDSYDRPAEKYTPSAGRADKHSSNIP